MKISGKLGNQGFLDKAPEVIKENKARLAEEEARRMLQRWQDWANRKSNKTRRP